MDWTYGDFSTISIVSALPISGTEYIYGWTCIIYVSPVGSYQPYLRFGAIVIRDVEFI